jgi:hypothetical protein
MRNVIIEHWKTHQDLGPWIAQAVEDICRATGFQVDGELNRRTIYDPNKTWRIRYSGRYKNQPALLRVENIRLEVDEEIIRAQFRKQCEGTRVRPPRTFLQASFKDAKGYAFSIDEFVEAPALFEAWGSSEKAVHAFVPFYRELQSAVREPFWEGTDEDANGFSQDQMKRWTELAREKNPEAIDRHAPLLGRLKAALQERVEGPLRFMHAHLAGADVRVKGGEYIVFANHFWSWRQSGYDICFPIWGQWMALPKEKRRGEAIMEITETWLKAVGNELSDLASVDQVRTLLFNRLYGSLILDIPARRQFEDASSVDALELAFVQEAERLLE